MIEFFSGITAFLMWLPLSLFGFFSEIYFHAFVDDRLDAYEPGIVYSFKQAEDFGFEPKQALVKILDQLEPKYLRVIAYWDRIEKQPGIFDFSEIDFQMKEAQRRGIKVTLIIGEKTPRWPECHYPSWLDSENRQERQVAVMKYLEAIVKKYREDSALEFWQLENEPFLAFGECPNLNHRDFYEKLKLLKSLDNREIILTTSGELDTWFRAFAFGDRIGFSVYRRFFVSTPWKKIGLDYPILPNFYSTKASFWQLFFKKEVMITELQLEPWLEKKIVETPLEDQFRELDFDRLVAYLDYAERIRLPRFYLWGVEWWLWLEENGHPEFINYVAKNVFFN